MVKRFLASVRANCCPPSASTPLPDTQPLVRIFKALADETRLKILALLGSKGAPLCACDIESQFDLSQPTVSHHLKVLREAGLVHSERRGTWIYYELDRETIAKLSEVQRLLGG